MSDATAAGWEYCSVVKGKKKPYVKRCCVNGQLYLGGFCLELLNSVTHSSEVTAVGGLSQLKVPGMETLPWQDLLTEIPCAVAYQPFG